MSATEGMGRRNSTMARVAARTPGRLPSTTPAGTATTTAMARPSAQAPMVAATSARNCPLTASPAARASTVEASGSTARLMTPTRPKASPANRNTATPPTPRAQPGMLQPGPLRPAGLAMLPGMLAPAARPGPAGRPGRRTRSLIGESVEQQWLHVEPGLQQAAGQHQAGHPLELRRVHRWGEKAEVESRYRRHRDFGIGGQDRPYGGGMGVGECLRLPHGDLEGVRGVGVL